MESWVKPGASMYAILPAFLHLFLSEAAYQHPFTCWCYTGAQCPRVGTLCWEHALADAAC